MSILLRYSTGHLAAGASHADLAMPKGAVIRSAYRAAGASAVEGFAEINPEAPDARRRLIFVRRGEPVPPGAPYLCTLTAPPEVVAVYDGGELSE